MPAMAMECSVVEKVTEKEARMLAEYQLKYLIKLSDEIDFLPFKVWKGAKIGDMEKKYTSEGVLTAYDFKVVKDDKIVGQILVNARKAGVPIVEYSLNKNVSFGKTKYLPLFDASEKYLKQQ
jgi:hypothetical protein